MLSVDIPEPVATASDPRFQNLTNYLQSKVEGLEGVLQFSRFPGGFSNQTFLVSSSGRELVLKAAPPGAKARGAHDVGREFEIVSKLYSVYPYLPHAVLRCDDLSVFGERFCVMERLQGIVVRAYPDDGSVSADQPARHFTRLIDALAELHTVDYAAAGLVGLGKPQGYRERQLKGWQDRLEAARTDDMADFTAVVAWLSGHAPSGPQSAAIVHNDFKLDNLMWDARDISKLIGVLDWEMATLGDPLMDLACTLSFWIESGDPAPFRALRGMPSAMPGVMSRHEALSRYSLRIGREVADFKFYLCFALLRRAAIEQQKYVRYRTGESTDTRFAELNHAVTVLRDMCLEVIEDKLRV